MMRLLEDTVNATETEHHDEDHDADLGKPWGNAIGASLLIQAVTFSGLVVVGFASCFQQFRQSQRASDTTQMSTMWKCTVEIVIPSFAAGALLATAVFLLIPEALELLAGGESHEEHAAHEEEVHAEDEFAIEAEEEAHEEHGGGAAWKFGAALIGGFLFPVLLGALFPSHNHVPITEDSKEKTSNASVDSEPIDSVNEVVDDDEVTDSDPVKAPHITTAPVSPPSVTKPELVETTRVNMPLALGILVGDVCHNLADGFFLGTAFLLCTKTLAWTIVAATVYHELAQEVADFFLLTHHCGLSILQALALNFAAGFSVVLGVIIVFMVDLGNEAIGVILSVSAGVYLYIAVGECLPRVLAVRKTARDSLVFIAFFVLGAVPIGLVLLNHVHCEATASSSHAEENITATEEEGHDDHEGHDHLRFLLGRW